MMSGMVAPMGEMTCALCRFTGSDVRIGSCGCTIHAKCAPLNLLVGGRSDSGNCGEPVQPNSILCPACHSTPVPGFQLFPMSMDDIERAVELKKLSARKKAAKSNSSDASKKGTENDFEEVQAEASYLLLSHTRSSSGLASDSDYQRTGRWTEEEMAYVDFLLDAFDKGKLPMPNGIRLNDFLAEMLLCKGSRLTKKMKNMHLSSRTYEFHIPGPGMVELDRLMMSSLEDKFLQSVNSEASRLELRFHMTKSWRSHFSNLSLQVGSNLLDATDWVASLEDMEHRASQAEEAIRKARRRRMGLALRTDARTAQDGVFFAGLPVKRPESKSNRRVDGVASSSEVAGVARGDSAANLHSITDSSSTAMSVASSDGSEADFISNLLDLGAEHPSGLGADFSMIFDDDMFDQPASEQHQTTHLIRNNCGPFLEEIVSYMESKDLPFEHVDVWVPSYSPKGQGKVDELRLFHSGHATRSDLDPALYCKLSEYGEYSTRFSFAPGTGLPGRVYSSGQPSWECRIDDADPKVFERAGGAKVYGVKTGFGLPLKTNVIGKIIVSMYSTKDLPEDAELVKKCMTDLSAYCPEPKWKLVVEMGATVGGNKAIDAPSAAVLPAPSTGSGIVHYHHSAGSDPNIPISSEAAGTKITHYRHTANSVTSLTAAAHPLASTTTTGTMTTQGSMASMKSPASASNAYPEDEEQRIASLLGDHMPLQDLPAPGKSTSSSAAPSLLVPHFMSLRLLLLRSPERRSDQDNEVIDIIKKSFRGYSRGTRRSDKDIALLLLKDWQYIQATYRHENDSKPAAKPSDAHQCHVMGVPSVSTYSSTGGPVTMPNSLSWVDPSKVRRSSFDDNPSVAKKRKISASDEIEQSNSINIVDIASDSS